MATLRLPPPNPFIPAAGELALRRGIVFVCAYVRALVRVCVRACVRACVRVWLSGEASLSFVCAREEGGQGRENEREKPCKISFRRQPVCVCVVCVCVFVCECVWCACVCE